MDKARIIKWLRISATAVLSFACLTFIGLWKRSQHRSDYLHWRLYGTREFEVNSQYGLLTLSQYDVRIVSPSKRKPGWWSHSSIPIEELSAKNPLSLQRDVSRFGYFRF